MAKAQHAAQSRAHKSYAKRISDHVATALVVYTLMLIFVTSPAMESSGTSILPYFMLVVFVAMVIPACRNMERRWKALEAGGSGDESAGDKSRSTHGTASAGVCESRFSVFAGSGHVASYSPDGCDCGNSSHHSILRAAARAIDGRSQPVRQFATIAHQREDRKPFLFVQPSALHFLDETLDGRLL